ncbi:monovalent cation/H(+) antiporter subunit G [Magnetovibrio sp.]|uniref:monovalent cation/H(+) antiporter subunit G n=1 Tax=Magnetovibrio sp. TaxID=2024836 RepID=UPI002F958A34
MPDILNTMIGPLVLADWLSWFCIVTGSFFAIVGALGIVRLPDVFSRMHGAGIIDTLGIMMILTGLMFQADEAIVVIKLALILLFIFFTSPTTTFALARAAIHGGVTPGPTAEEMAESQKAKASAKDNKNKEAASSNT